MENLKVTLCTKKVVVLRNIEIEDQERAVESSAAKCGNAANQLVLSMHAQKEMIKLLIVSVDGKALTGSERETIIKSFTYQEYQQLASVVEGMMENPTKAVVEMVSSTGAK